MKQKFKVGDKVKALSSFTVDTTGDKIYKVIRVSETHIWWEDDVSENYIGINGFENHFTLVKSTASLTISILPVKRKGETFYRYQFKSKNGEKLNDLYPTKGNASRGLKKFIKDIQENNFEIVNKKDMENREIKFRAWDGLRMTTSGIMFNCSTSILEVPEGSKMKLMQYTGFKDSVGKEIYEGDCYKTLTEMVYTIFFKDGAFCGGQNYEVAIPIGFSEEKNEPDYEWISRQVKVVGNIYENPDLLK
jgi:uncharacterized phage protein (TIGR01671 family)